MYNEMRLLFTDTGWPEESPTLQSSSLWSSLDLIVRFDLIMDSIYDFHYLLHIKWDYEGFRMQSGHKNIIITELRNTSSSSKVHVVLVQSITLS